MQVKYGEDAPKEAVHPGSRVQVPQLQQGPSYTSNTPYYPNPVYIFEWSASQELLWSSVVWGTLGGRLETHLTLFFLIDCRTSGTALYVVGDDPDVEGTLGSLQDPQRYVFVRIEGTFSIFHQFIL